MEDLQFMIFDIVNFILLIFVLVKLNSIKHKLEHLELFSLFKKDVDNDK